MPKSPKVRKESSKRERVPEREDPQVEAKGNKSKEMKTIIREIGEETARIKRGEQRTKKGIRGSEREEGLAKERISVSERGDERKRRKMAAGGGRLDEKDENDRGKDGTKRKEGEEE
jgi:hypothetical protein